ncbi:hypothetical protein [Roseivivax marinus]|jgi:hypothetical protein|uniref:hypothetical protein n=1 Tax=Roseivivax marinus TaxID=1379903 RepID=UPI00273E8373|nr:hypothetical protein [Roseivivax marinus]
MVSSSRNPQFRARRPKERCRTSTADRGRKQARFDWASSTKKAEIGLTAREPEQLKIVSPHNQTRFDVAPTPLRSGEQRQEDVSSRPPRRLDDVGWGQIWTALGVMTVVAVLFGVL